MRNPFQSLLESQVAKVTENLKRALEELDRMELEGSSGGGAVKIRMTGTAQVLAVEISEAALRDNDRELLQDLVAAALRDAMAKLARTRKEKLIGATPLGALGIEVPDLF